jgi:hypothetical protein
MDSVLISLIVAAHFAFASDLPNPGDPDNPTSPGPIAFDVLQEGMYALEVTCAPTPKDCNPYLAKQLDRLSVVDSHSMLGVWVNLASTNPATVLDGFYAAKIGPDAYTVVVEPRPGGHDAKFSYVGFKIDPATGSLDGKAYDFKSAGYYAVHGKPLVRIADLMKGDIQTGGKSDDLLAKYHGALNGIAGSLTVNKTPTGKLFAHFASDDSSMGQPYFELTFNGGAWNPTLGLLQLVNQNPRFFAEGELAMVLRPDGSLHGIYVNGFVSSPVRFLRS